MYRLSEADGIVVHMLRGIATVSFYADDLEAASSFYTKLLGIEPYFQRPGYGEFRIGDYQQELGIIDRKYAPPQASSEPGGAVLYWHVDDLTAVLEKLASLEGAVRGYKEINLRALRLLQPGGILVSCSCSHHMTEAQLLGIIAGAALDTGKQLRVLERRTQAQDHPILLTVPETHYLKCLVLQVM